jgi:hypothetical protein
MTAYESTTVQINNAEYGSCALIQDLLPLYLEGEVSSGSRDTIVEHLGRCERCAAYLAGAQSVRAQLRRDRTARERVAERVAPRPALSQSSRLANLIMMLSLCGLGALATLLFWLGAEHHSPILLGGMVLGVASAGGLAGLARRQRQLTLPRWIVLLSSCVLGALATILLAVPRQPGPLMMGMVMLMLAISGIWMTVLQEPRAAD